MGGSPASARAEGSGLGSGVYAAWRRELDHSFDSCMNGLCHMLRVEKKKKKEKNGAEGKFITLATKRSHGRVLHTCEAALNSYHGNGGDVGCH